MKAYPSNTPEPENVPKPFWFQTNGVSVDLCKPFPGSATMSGYAVDVKDGEEIVGTLVFIQGRSVKELVLGHT